MGNYRFRISSIIPNSWFYKLKDSTSSNKITKKPQMSIGTNSSSFQSPPSSDGRRKSYYFTRDLQLQDSPTLKTRSPDPPRKSSKKRRPLTPKKHIHRNLVSGDLRSSTKCSYRVTPESVWTESNSSDTENPLPELSLSCSCKTNSSYNDVYGKVDLPPIITKQGKQHEFGSGKWVIDGGSRSLSVNVVKEDINGVSKTGVRNPVRKMKGNSFSPRIGNRVKVQGINGGRRSNANRRRLSVSESMAVVKTSVDPGRDFKESMVEMIMENNMRSSKDLEDLLACYLSLNSDEYHDLIIKVFKQIWFESINY